MKKKLLGAAVLTLLGLGFLQFARSSQRRPNGYVGGFRS